MQFTSITRRAPAGLATILAVIGLLTGGAVSAQSGLQYAIVTSGAGSVVAQIVGSVLPAGAVMAVTLPGQTYTPSTGQTSPLPVGTKVVPLYIVGTPAGMTPNVITGIKPPASVKCPVNQLPTLILPSSGPKSVMAAANWHCKSGSV